MRRVRFVVVAACGSEDMARQWPRGKAQQRYRKTTDGKQKRNGQSWRAGSCSCRASSSASADDGQQYSNHRTEKQDSEPKHGW